MMKRFAALLIAILMIHTGCSADIIETPPPEPERIEPPVESEPEPESAIFPVHKDAEKYADYFSYTIDYLFADEADDGGFVDAAMAMYAYFEIWKLRHGEGKDFDFTNGESVEVFNYFTQKHFGRTPQSYDTRWTFVMSETGNVNILGHSPSVYPVYILRDLTIDENGVSTGAFYYFWFFPEESADMEELFRGEFEKYRLPLFTTHPATLRPTLRTIVFEERFDENGEMYLFYHDAYVGTQR